MKSFPDRIRVGRFIYRNFTRPFYRVFRGRTWLFYVSLAGVFFLGALIFAGARYLVDLIYEPGMNVITSKGALSLLVFIPLMMILLLIFISIKILIDHLRRAEGTGIRYKLFTYFLLVTLIPSIIYIYIFSAVLNATIEVFFQPGIIISLENSLSLLKDNIDDRKANNLRNLRALDQRIPRIQTNNGRSLSNLYAAMGSRGIGTIYVFRGSKKVASFTTGKEPIEFQAHMAQWKPQGNISDGFSDYNLRRNLILSAAPAKNNSTITLVALKNISPGTSQKIRDTVSAVTRLKQFQILKVPLKNALLIIYLYFYIPILTLGILFFYFKSNSISTPLGQISTATKRISNGDFSFRIDLMGNDEVRDLVLNFKSMARELMYNRIRLKNISRTEAWRDVAVKLAHELKNPLTPMLLATEKIENEVMKKDFDTYSRLNDSFNLVKDGISSIEALIKDFSKFSRDIEITRSPFKISKFLEDLEKELSHYPGTHFEIRGPGDNVLINADYTRLKQVLINLVQNACDSMRDAKTIDPQIHIRVKKTAADFLQFRINDNGPGIHKDIEEKIFEPYFTSKKKGTGLGLSICERIITAHNGKIFFDSIPENTSFYLELPLKDRKEEENTSGGNQ